jgi:ABC-type multidrug transport system ATPase subunit
MGERKTSVLITSHILSDLERIVDRVGFLIGGRIGLEGSLDELKERCALIFLKNGEPPPDGVVELRRRPDGRVLVTGDLESLHGTKLQRLNLEDLYVELLGVEGKECDA